MSAAYSKLQQIVRAEVHKYLKENMKGIVQPLVKEAVVNAMSHLLSEGMNTSPAKPIGPSNRIIREGEQPTPTNRARGGSPNRAALAQKYGFEPIAAVGAASIPGISADNPAFSILQEIADSGLPLDIEPSILDRAEDMTGDAISFLSKDYSKLMDSLRLKNG